MDSIRCNSTDVKMIAHRGLSDIEADLHVTDDGKFILHHDDSALRLTE